jgi:DnaK suppressor protein
MQSRYPADFLVGRKAELLRQKAELETELNRIARFDQASGSWAPLQPDYDAGSAEDAGDSGGEAQDFQENQAQMVELEKSLEEINSALDKMAQGTYGRCESTGDWIDDARLMAYPAARTCTDD